jgi:uncharacterized protein
MSRSLDVSRRAFMGGLLATAAGVAVTAPRLAFATGLSADEIALRAARVDKVRSWQALCHIAMTAPGATPRERKGDVANLLREDGETMMRLYRFSAPADLNGTALLIHENEPEADDMWLYLPSAGKARRILSSRLNNSFVGTEFAYIDLMTHRVDKYRHTLVGREVEGGIECFVVDAEPVDAEWAESIGYGKERAWHRSDTFAAVRIDYDDLRGQPLKRQVLSDFHEADPAQGRYIARHRHMANLQNGRETVITFADLEVDAGVSGRLFQPARLGR